MLAIVILHVKNRTTRLAVNLKTILVALIFTGKQPKYGSLEQRLRFNIICKRRQLLMKESKSCLAVSGDRAAPAKCLSTWKAVMLSR